MKTIKKINWKPMLFKNWLLKLISFIFAFILWFVVITEDKQPFEFKYIYESGKLICLNTTQSVEVAGLLSERHLCSSLFYARD